MFNTEQNMAVGELQGKLVLASHSYTTSRENFTSGFLKRCFPTNVGCFQGFHVIGFASCWRYRRMVAPLSLRRVWLETSGWMNRARASQRVYVDVTINIVLRENSMTFSLSNPRQTSCCWLDVRSLERDDNGIDRSMNRRNKLYWKQQQCISVLTTSRDSDALI
ncbi:hypothetical protein V1477_001231 [Vespula maculifrons]|uniref:Uncharacterized protein n=1 Tax=Vespula maculifrons TaxID=7453 RepID=A0ABD2CZB3_VESMC